MSVWIAAASWNRVDRGVAATGGGDHPGGVLAAGGEIGAQRGLAVSVDGFEHPVGVLFDETAAQQGCSCGARRR